jgi:hypothetical protein
VTINVVLEEQLVTRDTVLYEEDCFFGFSCELENSPYPALSVITHCSEFAANPIARLHLPFLLSLRSEATAMYA